MHSPFKCVSIHNYLLFFPPLPFLLPDFFPPHAII
nr:MAG TPA: hypothetical protein [Caudoviricetes sp.]